MKKLLSLTLVLMLLFTTISFTSVSAAPVNGYVTGNWKTILKSGYETGDVAPGSSVTGAATYNMFQSDYTGGSKLNLKPTATAYSSLGFSAPVAKGESFGVNVGKVDFSSAKNTVCAIRARVPFNPIVEAGKTYRASVWVKADNYLVSGSTYANIALDFGDNKNSDPSSWWTVKTGEWVKLVTEVTATAAHAKATTFIVKTDKTQSPTVLYFDNFRVEEFVPSKDGSDVIAYTSFPASTGTAYGAGTDTTYAIAPGGAGVFPTTGTLADTYVGNSNSTSYVETRTLYNSASPVYNPSVSPKLFKNTATNNGWLIRFKNTFAASDIKVGDVVRYSVDVYLTDVVAHGKLKNGTIGAPAEKSSQNISIYPTSGTDQRGTSNSYMKIDSVPVGKWYRVEKVSTIESGWASTGIRMDTNMQQTNINAHNQPFPSTVYVDNYRFEKVKSGVSVTVGASSEEAGVSVTGAGTYTSGNQVTVTAPATAAGGAKKFEGWYDGYVCVSTSATYKFTAVNSVNLVAKYTANTVELVLNNASNGSVSGAASDLAFGTEVTAVATPADGYAFGGWFDASNALVSKKAEYTFNITENTELTPYFIKASVDGWHELSNVNAEDGYAPSTSCNFWGVSSAGGNTASMAEIVTYDSQSEVISKPNQTEDFGSNLIMVDKANQATATTGVHTFRINGIKGIRYTAGDKYKMSAWVYVKEKADGSTTGTVTVPFALYYTNLDFRDVNSPVVPVGEWTKIEGIYTVDEDNNNFLTSTETGWRANMNHDLDKHPAIMYIDNFKIEKLDGVTVSADATNGIVYGTGVYAKGSEVTLNAGADAGYKFAGYYREDATLISSTPTYKFTATEDINVVARFVEADAYVKPSDVLYYFGSETGDVGINNNWMYLPTGKDGASKQESGAPYNSIITYKELAQEGIYAPSNDPIFGSKLYQQKRLNGDIKSQIAGRFRGWENGGEAVTTKYFEGYTYKLTWWVNPVSMQLANGETSQPDTASIKINMQYGALKNGTSHTTGIEETFTLKVGEWNKIEWTFTANKKMAEQVPGLRYDWVAKENADTELLTAPNWMLYDALTIEKVATKYSWGAEDTDNNYGSGWIKIKGADEVGYAHTNVGIDDTVSYDDVPSIATDKFDGGEKVRLYDVTNPVISAEQIKTYGEDAVKAATSIDKIGGSGIEARILHIAGYNGKNEIKATYVVGQPYKVSLWVRPEAQYRTTDAATDVATTARIKLIGSITSGTTKAGRESVTDVPMNEWTQISLTFIASAADNAVSPSFYIADLTKNIKGNEDVYLTKLYIDNLTVEKLPSDRLILSISEDETKVTAEAMVTEIKSGDSLKAIVIIAAYDVDGKLISVALSSANGESVSEGSKISATYTKADGIDKYVAFLWDDLANIRPYVLPVKLGE